MSFKEHHLTVPSNRASIREIDPFLQMHGVASMAAERYHDLLVALTEAVNNAITHGNQGDPSKSVQIDVQVGNGEIIAIIQDHGSGFDPKTLPDPRDPENLLKEGGRGVFLIQHLADVVEFRVDDGGTAVLIKFFI